MPVRAVFLVFLISSPLHAQDTPAPPPGKGVIRGVVTAAETGRPIRGADIRVGGANALTEPVWARTDEQGRYEVSGLATGRYTLTASQTGYQTLGYGQRRSGEAARPVEVSDATPQSGVNFALPRGGVIVARVTDSFGDPVRGIVVRPLVARYVNGQRQLQPAPGAPPNVTDDHGEIRLYGLGEGEYYVGTDPTISMMFRSEATTFHPGTLQADEALPVRLGPGDEISVTFPMIRVRPARLSGVIIGSTGAPLAGARASLARTGLGSGSSSLIPVAADGTFTEGNLAAGDYAIEVREPEHAIHRVRLSGTDVANVVITTRRPAAVRGRLTFEDGAPTDSVTIRPMFVGTPIMAGLPPGSVRWSGGAGQIDVTAADEWRFEAQIAGTGVMRVWPPASPWFLKAVTLDGRDVTETELDFAAYDGKPLEITLTRRGAGVSGTVTDDRGQQIQDCTVLIFPEDEALWTTFSRFIAAGRPDQEGRFALSRLPAGRYLITAVHTIENGEERHREALGRLRAGATALTLAEGESRSITLRLRR